MDGRRWWDAAFGGTAIVVGVVVWLGEPDGATETISRLGAWAILLILCACYYTFGRRQLVRAETGYLFQTVLIVGVAVGAAFSPNMLTMQVVMIPLLWVLTHNTRTAIILNIVSAVALATGYTIGIHGSESALPQAVFIQGISLVFSIAFGLWISRIHEYGAERARLLRQLQDAQAETERASRDAGGAAERERMARDIHDTIAQSLTSVVMLAQRARAESPVSPDTIDLIETTAREALGEARALVATNAGFPASDVGLRDSLQRLAARFQRETGIGVTVEATSAPIPRPVEVVLLRSAQEGLANVRKHARAANVVIALGVESPYADGGMFRADSERMSSARGVRSDMAERRALPSDTQSRVLLTVRDDGVGFPADDATGRGFGIEGMQSRVELLGGRVKTANPAGGGALLTVEVPLLGEDGTRDVGAGDSGLGDNWPGGDRSGGDRLGVASADDRPPALLAASVAEHLRAARSARSTRESSDLGPVELVPGPDTHTDSSAAAADPTTAPAHTPESTSP